MLWFSYHTRVYLLIQDLWKISLVADPYLAISLWLRGDGGLNVDCRFSQHFHVDQMGKKVVDFRWALKLQKISDLLILLLNFDNNYRFSFSLFVDCRFILNSFWCRILAKQAYML